jgi:S1 RNA binding domain
MKLPGVVSSRLPTLVSLAVSNPHTLLGGIVSLRERIAVGTDRARRELGRVERDRDRWRERAAMLEREHYESGSAQPQNQEEDGLQLGQFIRARVSGIADRCVYVELDGQDRLVHIPELSWGDVRDPSDVLSIGSRVWVKLLSTPAQAMHPYLVLAPEYAEER